MNWVVVKFDSEAISSPENYSFICEIISHHLRENKKLLIVCPELSGYDSKIRSLIDNAIRFERQDDFSKQIQEWRQSIVDVCCKLITKEQVDQHFSPILDHVEKLLNALCVLREASPRVRALLISTGSEIVAKLLVLYLNQVALPSKKIKDVNNAYYCDSKLYLESYTEFNSKNEKSTSYDLAQRESDKYLNAICYQPFKDAELLKALADKGRLVVCAGNVAQDNGEITVLGEGGSDMSAAYFSSKLEAEKVEFWTSEYGILTCPGMNSRTIKKLRYDEAIEISATDSRIVHPMALKILQETKIDAIIRSRKLYGKFFGTVISSDSTDVKKAALKSICVHTDIELISIESFEMWRKCGFLAEIFHLFKIYGVSVDFISTSQSNVTVTLDNTSVQKHKISQLKNELQQLNYIVESKSPCAAISLIGNNVTHFLGKIGTALKTFNRKIYLTSQSASNVNFTFLVDQNLVEEVIEKLHSSFFGTIDQDDDYIGPLLNTLISETKTLKNEVSGEHVWWRKKRTKLLELVQQHGTPLYVYDHETITDRVNSLLDLKKQGIVDRFFFALKANSNTEILKALEKLGMGFECVSLNEVKLILSLFPKFDKKKILFTPNFAPRSEYEEGFSLGVNVTLDNMHPLINWGDTFKNREIFLRVDPGVGHGHHKKVKTAGVASKFGIPINEMNKLKEITTSLNVKVIGLHCHVGSGIFDTKVWPQNAEILSKLIELFPHVHTIDLGGGLGVPYKPEDKPIDLKSLADSLKLFKINYPKINLALEPGRYPVAESGVLLAKVTQTKSKGKHMYVGVDCGMNTLLRPALYNSYHEIVNLTRIDEEKCWIADVVGPICETGDILGTKRKLPKCVHDDVMLIATAGAYGAVMSSNYNLRTPAKEILIPPKEQ